MLLVIFLNVASQQINYFLIKHTLVFLRPLVVNPQITIPVREDGFVISCKG